MTTKDYCAPPSTGECSCRKFGQEPDGCERGILKVKPHGCFNRELRDKLFVQDGWHNLLTLGEHVVRVPLMKEIDDPMSKECQYSKSYPDERCDGCKHQYNLEKLENERLREFANRLQMPVVVTVRPIDER